MFCGKNHERDRNKCPAFGKICTKCKKKNHFAKCCNPQKSSERPKSQHKVHDLQSDSSEEEALRVTQVNEVRDSNKIFATMLIESKPVKMQIDSGATCNILPKKFVPTKVSIVETRKELVSYCKNKLKPLVSLTLVFATQRITKSIELNSLSSMETTPLSSEQVQPKR